MKYILIIIIVLISYLVYTGNMGGAREATKNYIDVRSKAKPSDEHKDYKSPLESFIEYKQSNK